MEALINQVHQLLIKNKKTIAVAESCTGGMLSEFLTRYSGSSRYFLLGITAYSNKAKNKILKIPDNVIRKYTAVSKKVAQKMAQSAKILAKADFGIGITGIAGPTGGTLQKPVGTVFIAVDSKNKKICERFLFRGTRIKIREAAALQSLELLKRTLLK